MMEGWNQPSRNFDVETRFVLQLTTGQGDYLRLHAYMQSDQEADKLNELTIVRVILIVVGGSATSL